MLDADERISSELRTEIDQALDAKRKSANLPELSYLPQDREFSFETGKSGLRVRKEIES